MTAWTLAKCLYVVAGGLVTPALVSALFSRARAWDDLSGPVPAFAVVAGTLSMWPILLLLILEDKRDR